MYIVTIPQRGLGDLGSNVWVDEVERNWRISSNG
jgi:hypothetical protein